MNAEETGALFLLAVGMARGAALRRNMVHCEDDFVGVALEAVARAIEAHDPAIGDLRPFVAAWIAGELRSAAKREALRLVRERPLQDHEDPESSHPTLRAEELAREVMEAVASLCVGEHMRTGGEARLLTQEAWEALHEEIEGLTEDDQRLVDLRYWEGMTWRAVAGELGIAERTAQDRDARIRDGLRDRLMARQRVRPLRRGP